MQNGVFTIFHNSIEKAPIAEKILKVLKDFSIPVFIDGFKRDTTFFTEHYEKSDCVFFDFIAGEFLEMEKYYDDPVIVLNLNVDEKDQGQFEIVLEWLNNVFKGVFDNRIQDLYFKTVKLTGKTPAVNTCVAISELPKAPYTFRSEGNKYEICKPNVDRPYTTITDEVLDLFTNMFACASFGSEADVEFLKFIWEDLEMDGEFNMDELYIKRVKQITENPEEYPRVYRQKLEDV